MLYIGVRDGGDIEGGLNLDSLQKTFGKKLENAYPLIYYMTKMLVKDGKQFLAIIVPGSESRPTFAGRSYVRIGSEPEWHLKNSLTTLVAGRGLPTPWRVQRASDILHLPMPRNASQ